MVLLRGSNNIYAALHMRRPDLSCLQTSGKHGPALESAEVSVTCKLRTALARAFTLMTHCLSRRRTDWMATMRVTVLTNPARSMWKLLVSQPTLMELHSATETVYDTLTFWYTDWTLLLKSWKQVPWGCQHVLAHSRRSGVGQSVFMFVTDCGPCSLWTKATKPPLLTSPAAPRVDA